MDKYYFAILKTNTGRETFLIDIHGLEAINHSFNNDVHYQFQSYNPENLQEVSWVLRKNSSVFQIEFKGEQERE